MAPAYLDEIVQSHRQRSAQDSRDWRSRAGVIHFDGPSFALALRRGSSPYVKVVAEIKRRSPSKGALAPDLDVAEMACAYRDAGASAVSVLTDREFFDGSLEDLATVRAAINLPVLRKDFTVSENDVLDAAEAGASAILLIVAVLTDHELVTFVELAEQCGLDAVVEVHDAEEARRAIACGARIVGVNQRDLRTFAVDTREAASVIDVLPKECLAVCESGLSAVVDVERAAQLGFDAVLVGEAFVVASDPRATVRAFTVVPSVLRG